jgi:hypothetical protein
MRSLRAALLLVALAAWLAGAGARAADAERFFDQSLGDFRRVLRRRSRQVRRAADVQTVLPLLPQDASRY